MLTLQAYAALALFQTTDLALFIGNNVRLPVVGTEVSLRGFYVAVPWILLTIHIELLMSLGDLVIRIRNITNSDWSALDLRRIASLITGPTYIIFLSRIGAHRLLHFFHKFIFFPAQFWLTPFLMLCAQWRFLPYHDPTVMLAQQIALLLDCIISISFCITVFRNDAAEIASLVLPVFAVLFLGLCMVTIPGEGDPVSESPIRLIPRSILYKDSGDREPELRGFWVWWFKSRNLDLSNRIINELPTSNVQSATRNGDCEVINNVRKSETQNSDRLLDVRGRNFQHANFENAVLERIDFRGADTLLTDASFVNTRLRFVLLDSADVRHGNFEDSEISNTCLRHAKFDGANLRRVHFDSSDASFASFVNARFDDSHLWRFLFGRSKDASRSF
jgi:hypothetical protein